MNMLDWIKLLETLSDEDRYNLSFFCQEKFLKEGDVIFREWDEANAMYILKNWEFNIVKETNWKKMVLWTVWAEEILWEMALFWSTNKRMATAIATQDSILITILSFSIQDLAKKNPKLLDKIKSIIDNRIMSNKMREGNNQE